MLGEDSFSVEWIFRHVTQLELHALQELHTGVFGLHESKREDCGVHEW